MIRALVGIGVLQVLSMLLLLTRTKILALAVGVDGIGTIANVDALAAVVSQTLSLSLPFAALRFLPAALRESPAETDLLYRRMRLLLLLLLLPATAICLLLAVVSPHVFGAALLPYRRTVLLGLAGLPVVGLVAFLTNAYAGAVGHMASMRMTLAHSAVLAAAAGVAAAGGDVDGFYLTYAVAGTMLVVVAALRLSVPGLAPADRRPLRVSDAVRLPAVMWRFSAWLLPLTFLTPYAAWFVKYSTLEQYGVDAAGILQAAIGLSLSVRAVLGAAHAVFLTPNVNRQGDPRSRMAWADEFQRTTGLLFLLTLPPLLLFADVVMRILYASTFVAGASFAAIFVAAEVVAMLSATYQSLIVAGDFMRFHVVQNLAAQALLVGTAAVLLPRIGVAGAGVAVLSAPLLLLVTTLLFLHRQYGLRPSPRAFRTSALALAVLVVAGVIGSRFPGLSVGLLAAKLGVCALLWMTALLVVPPEDRRRARELAALGLARLGSRTASNDGVA